MSFLELKNINKIIENKNEKKIILKEINLSFPSTGLITIFGKSGSGKSTLINLLSLVDKPTSGNILLNSKDINTFKEKEKLFYRNKQIGILFQNYNLLEDETGYYNVSLPLLIANANKKGLENKIDDYLPKLSLTKDLMEKEVCLLSGGEKQRISLLRAIITSPRILLCDEPTGALDEKNSKTLMDILKKYSERHLVILVSHNENLVKKYSDQIIFLKDGEIEKIVNNDLKNIDLPLNAYEHYRNSSSWTSHITFKNFKRRKKRNFLSFLGLLIGSLSSLLVIGFENGNQNKKIEEGYCQFDYGSLTITKENKSSAGSSIISITNISRPTEEELIKEKKILDYFIIEPCFDAILPLNPTINYKNKSIEDLFYYPIYSFSKPFVNENLITKGRNVLNEYFEVIINNSAYQIIKEQIGKDPLNEQVEIYYESENKYLPSNEHSDYIYDSFIYSKKMRIVGVVEELSFLQTPKIYYSYEVFCEELLSENVSNLSSFYNQDISWYSRVSSASNKEEISSYSYRLFLKDINDVPKIEKFINSINKPLSLSSNAELIADTFSNLLSTVSLGLKIFLIIAIIGTILILGIISYSSYSEDKKRSAILTSIGASNDSIYSIYIGENMLVSLLSFIFSFLLAPLFAVIINKIIFSMSGIKNSIQIPLVSFNNIPFFLPIIYFLTFISLTLFATVIPIYFAKKVSLKEELETL